MKPVRGVYAEAKIFTDDVEDYALAQVKMICDNEVARGSTICMMPDVHPGRIAPIGLSMTVADKVIPQLLGVDIGCGMTCVKLNKNSAEFQKLDKVIRGNVPSGFAIRKEPHYMAAEFACEELHCIRHINRQKAARSLGTLGGGNHFIELEQSREIPYYMSYLEGDDKAAYLEDVKIIQQYAERNRQIIVREVLKGMKWKAVKCFSVPHNYVDDSGIFRKGAVSAGKGEPVVIPAKIPWRCQKY